MAAPSGLIAYDGRCLRNTFDNTKLLELLADFALGMACAHKVKPSLFGQSSFARHDFDHVTISKWLIEGLDRAIDPEGIGVLADVGVDKVGIVKRQGAFGQIKDIALWGVDKNTVTK